MTLCQRYRAEAGRSDEGREEERPWGGGKEYRVEVSEIRLGTWGIGLPQNRAYGEVN